MQHNPLCAERFPAATFRFSLFDFRAEFGRFAFSSSAWAIQQSTVCTPRDQVEPGWMRRNLHAQKANDARIDRLASQITHSRPAGYALLFSAVSDGGFVFLKRFLPALAARWLIGLVLD
jgi:hypothetical protein